MDVRMLVSGAGVVDVRMAVDDPGIAAVRVVGDHVSGRHGREASHRVAQPQHPQQDQHAGHDQLEAAAHRRRDRELEPDDERADDRQGRHVARAPEDADHRAVDEAALARQDRRDRDEVVGVRRVLQAEDEAEEDRREGGIQQRHSDILRRRPVRRARWIAARNAQWASAA
jgi:hypothetical protein